MWNLTKLSCRMEVTEKSFLKKTKIVIIVTCAWHLFKLILSKVISLVTDTRKISIVSTILSDFINTSRNSVKVKFAYLETWEFWEICNLPVIDNPKLDKRFLIGRIIKLENLKPGSRLYNDLLLLQSELDSGKLNSYLVLQFKDNLPFHKQNLSGVWRNNFHWR